MIEFRGVSKWYHTPHGRKIVLDGLDLTLPPVTKLGVLGRNGAGKSTLMKIIAGNFPPSTGTISLDGEEVVFHKPVEARRKGI
ncbi:ATP-binding cassette domain-containing protein, partial [Salmonella enterica subsp. enterica serovar 1,4,[5],12:i:-]